MSSLCVPRWQRRPADELELRQFRETRWLIAAYAMSNAFFLLVYLSAFGTDTLPAMCTAWLATLLQAIARFAVHYLVADHQRALYIFSWIWCLSLVVTWGPFCVGQHFVNSPLRVYPDSDLSRPGYLAACILWALYCFYQCHVAVATVPRAVGNIMIGLAFGCSWPPMSMFGQPTEGLLAAASIILAELLGFTVRVHRRHAAAVLDKMTFRVINHTAKRCMTNTAQGCQIVMRALRGEATEEEHPEVLKVLRQMRADSIAGFQMCNAILLEASLRRGGYASTGGDTFDIANLLADLGLDEDAAFRIHVASPELVCTDRSLLQLILFNAAQNARAHGEVGGPIAVRAWLEDAAEAAPAGGRTVEQRAHSTMHVTIENRRGANHERLLALGAENLFSLSGGELKRGGVGRAGESTYLGFGDMQLAASQLTPPATLQLRAVPHGVRFELTCRVEVKAAPGGASGTAARQQREGEAAPSPAGDATPSVPAGLTFVIVDDDMIPRLHAEVILEAARADMQHSLILGEAYEEVSALPARLDELRREVGMHRIICLLDQNMSYRQGDVLGTALCRTLRTQHGWKGLIFLHTANDEPDAIKFYLASGVDGCIGKAAQGGLQGLLNRLATAYEAHAQRWEQD